MPAPDASLAGEAFCYITTTGRVTGNPHTIEIWFALQEDVLYILTGGSFRSDTVRNLQKQPSCRVRLGDVTHEATGRVVTDETEDALARRLLLEKYHSSDDDLDSWSKTSLAVAFEFVEPDRH